MVIRKWEQKEAQWRPPSLWFEHEVIVGSDISMEERQDTGPWGKGV